MVLKSKKAPQQPINYLIYNHITMAENRAANIWDLNSASKKWN